MHQLSAVDAAFLELETPRTPMHVGTLALYEAPAPPGAALTRQALVDLIAARVHLSRTFRQRVQRVPFELDRPYWVEDPHFDLDAHVRGRTLPEPGDESTLWAEAARILAQPLDLSRPPWELWVIDGLSPATGATVALLAKVHHAAVDGLSGMEILAALHDREPRPPDVHRPVQRRTASRTPSDLELLARAGTNMLANPLRLSRMVQEGLTAAAERAQRPTRSRRPMPGAPRTRFNGLVDAERVVAGCTFAGRDLRHIRSQVSGATTNDVALGIVGGALRRHLSSLEELPDRPLVAMVPSSIRNRTDREAGNRVSAMLVPLGTHIADPVERLEVIAAATQRSKRRARGSGARRLIDYLDAVPIPPATVAAAPTWLATSGREPVMNCVVTNVPLARRPIYLAGSRLAHVFGSAPIVDGLGLMHVVLSYDGETTISTTSCPTMLPDPHRYTAHLRESFRELCDAVA